VRPAARVAGVFSWSHLGLVVAGGMLGTAARAGLSLGLGDALGVWLVPLVNLVGAFALGVLMGALLRRPASPRTRAVQQFAGTGVLGGFTTYSALAVESADPALIVLGIGAALAGTAAAWAGLMLARGRGGAQR
jgi:fluoride exporter